MRGAALNFLGQMETALCVPKIEGEAQKVWLRAGQTLSELPISLLINIGATEDLCLEMILERAEGFC